MYVCVRLSDFAREPFPSFLSPKTQNPKLSSALCPLSSALRPLSSVLRPLSSVLRLPPSVLCLPPSVLRPPSSVLCPPSSVFCPLSFPFAKRFGIFNFVWKLKIQTKKLSLPRETFLAFCLTGAVNPACPVKCGAYLSGV